MSHNFVCGQSVAETCFSHWGYPKTKPDSDSWVSEPEWAVGLSEREVCDCDSETVTDWVGSLTQTDSLCDWEKLTKKVKKTK